MVLHRYRCGGVPVKYRYRYGPTWFHIGTDIGPHPDRCRNVGRTYISALVSPVPSTESAFGIAILVEMSAPTDIATSVGGSTDIGTDVGEIQLKYRHRYGPTWFHIGTDIAPRSCNIGTDVDRYRSGLDRYRYRCD